MTAMRDKVIERLWRDRDARPAPRDAGVLLAATLRRTRPSVVAVVGTGAGGIALGAAVVLRDLGVDGVVVAVDTWLDAWREWIGGEPPRAPDGLAAFLAELDRAGLGGSVLPVRQDAASGARVLRRAGIAADVVHIAGVPGDDMAAATFRAWWDLLRPDGVLLGERAGGVDATFAALGLAPVEVAGGEWSAAKPAARGGRAAVESVDFKPLAQAATAWREARRIPFSALVEDETVGFWDLLDRYIRFDGPTWNGIRLRLMNRIVALLGEQGITASRKDIFGADFEVREEVLRDWLPEARGMYPRAVGTEGLATVELLAPTPNEYAKRALPQPINKYMALATRPALTLYKAENAELFVTPFGFQLHDRGRGTYWPVGSSRAYSAEAVQGARLVVRQPVVIVQDVFEGTNFSHFLFDWMPRLAHFLAAEVEPREACLFLMGGAPGEFHDIVLGQFRALHGVRPEQFVFPTESEQWRIEAPAYFFSDLKADIIHPAHMAHERSIGVIRDIAAGIDIPATGDRKIYISRSDTPLRKLANEHAVWRALQPFGFVMVRLSDMSVAEQIRTVRSAAVIVAPHGMGLTHIALHTGRPVVVELHNPMIGTDAYAFIAHAMGFPYRAVFGKALGNAADDFTVAPQDVLNALIAEGVVPGELPPGGLAEGPALLTHMYMGVQRPPATEAREVPPPSARAVVYRHVRADPATQPDNNLGWLEARPVEPGLVYFCACDVWIAGAYRGDAVALFCDAFRRPVAAAADMALRDRWQTISIQGAAGEALCNFVLRATAKAGDIVYSSRWRVGAGPAPRPG